MCGFGGGECPDVLSASCEMHREKERRKRNTRAQERIKRIKGGGCSE
jgi:hypothetical protein